MALLIFSAEEILGAKQLQVCTLAEHVLELSDLDKKPLQPGETPDARRHQLASLGKQLAQAYVEFSAAMAAYFARVDSARPEPEPAERTSKPESN